MISECFTMFYFAYKPLHVIAACFIDLMSDRTGRTSSVVDSE